MMPGFVDKEAIAGKRTSVSAIAARMAVEIMATLGAFRGSTRNGKT